MVLHRLDVTEQAFGRSERANKAGFEGLMERVRREAEEEGYVTLLRQRQGSRC